MPPGSGRVGVVVDFTIISGAGPTSVSATVTGLESPPTGAPSSSTATTVTVLVHSSPKLPRCSKEKLQITLAKGARLVTPPQSGAPYVSLTLVKVTVSTNDGLVI